MIDNVDNRAITVNYSVAEYQNEATLINVMRAANGEPLTFLSLSQVQGHNTMTGTAAIPSMTVGPNQTDATRLKVFGPNSTSRSASNDFTMNTVDDQSTYAALYSPITPGSVSLLIAQGYSREFLFKLLLDRMRIYIPFGGAMPDGVKVDDPNGRWVTLVNDPSFYNLYADTMAAEGRKRIPTATQDVPDAFNIAIDQLINEGLTIQYRQSSGLLSSSGHDNVRICMDPEGLGNIYPMERREMFHTVQTSLTDTSPANNTMCDASPWSAGDDGSAGYRITLDNGTKVEFYFRSVYGTYMFVSQFVPDTPRYANVNDRLYAPLFTSQYRAALIDHRLNPADSQALFEVRQKHGKAAFVDIRYGGDDWEVPDSAHSTKMVFAVIHQLVQLYSLPNDQRGNTGSVRGVN